MKPDTTADIERDRLWCEAAIGVLSPDSLERLMGRFNRLRVSAPNTDAWNFVREVKASAWTLGWDRGFVYSNKTWPKVLEVPDIHAARDAENPYLSRPPEFDTFIAGPKVAQKRADWRATHTTERKHVMESKYNIGDIVSLNFFAAGRLRNCKVLAVQFTQSAVSYDVLVNTGEGDTVIRDVDSAMVQ